MVGPASYLTATAAPCERDGRRAERIPRWRPPVTLQPAPSADERTTTGAGTDAADFEPSSGDISGAARRTAADLSAFPRGVRFNSPLGSISSVSVHLLTTASPRRCAPEQSPISTRAVPAELPDRHREDRRVLSRRLGRTHAAVGDSRTTRDADGACVMTTYKRASSPSSRACCDVVRRPSSVSRYATPRATGNSRRRHDRARRSYPPSRSRGHPNCRDISAGGALRAASRGPAGEPVG